MKDKKDKKAKKEAKIPSSSPDAVFLAGIKSRMYELDSLPIGSLYLCSNTGEIYRWLGEGWGWMYLKTYPNSFSVKISK